ncbi:uncharacterized protein PRCAT00006114001 [Priceomyces carsonii]|uniref:uncharacterized protein n=1 Tax=Priceomyces carsonii TaxID=28549 RepID=UPI002EDAC98C|nr:unnamed protein product [Priceomyces carsonii]
MDSPFHDGDTTTMSIQRRLNNTHLCQKWFSSLEAASYGGTKVILLNIRTKSNALENTILVFRRVHDSYFNVTQLLSTLVKLGHLSEAQLESFLKNEILTNTDYLEDSSTFIFDDFRRHKCKSLRGVWIPYDRAVSLALKFDIYDVTKKLFLVDVHKYDLLPKVNKHPYNEDDNGDDSNLMGSPTKKQKMIRDDHQEETTDNELIKDIARRNPNFPFTLPALTGVDDQELVSDIKQKFSEIFKKDEEELLSSSQIKTIFQSVLNNDDAKLDIPLDQQGQTALHFAATLASSNLVSSFIRLGLNSPIRGNLKGESPLISTILVTNSMEKGNFADLLKNWLWPNLWLYSNSKWTFLHYLASQSSKKFESSKFYLTKILEYLVLDESLLNDFLKTIINAQDETDGNTCLHLAAENESKWFIKILLTLKADTTIANKVGVRPTDYDIVKDAKDRTSDFEEEHIFDLVRTSIEFLDDRIEANCKFESEDGYKWKETKPEVINSNKILQSIQDLLSNTNVEYESIINAKKQQINQLNKSLRDSTMTTANNRFLARKVGERLVHLDNLKLQIANITDKLQLSRREDVALDQEVDGEFNADEPFIIQPLFDKLSNDEDPNSLRNDEEFLKSLPSVGILKARIKSYKELNNSIETEISHLMDYSKLTSKFKKVVGICTGVDINDVDELLDGLLEAVEGQL